MKKLIFSILLFISCLFVKGHDVNIMTFRTDVTPSPLLANLLDYWKFNESSGTFAGALGHTATGSGVTYEVTGKIGRAVGFDTNTDYVTIPVTGIVPTANVFTISCWFKIDTLPSVAARPYYLASAFHDGGSFYSWKILIDTQDYLFFDTKNSANAGADVRGSKPSIDTWYHLVCINRGEGSPPEIYINGTSVDSWHSGNFTGTLMTTDTEINIGNYAAAKSYAVDGIIDEFGIWNEAWSTDKITEDYNSGSGKTYPF